VIILVVVVSTLTPMGGGALGADSVLEQAERELAKPTINIAWKQKGSKPSGKEQSGKEQSGKEQSGKEQSGREQSGREQIGSLRHNFADRPSSVFNRSLDRDSIHAPLDYRQDT
jgi:hypothetical protein